MKGDMLWEMWIFIYNVFPHQSSKGDQPRQLRTSMMTKVTATREYLTYCHILHETTELAYSIFLRAIQQSPDMRVVCYSFEPGRLHP